jgi:hypothetical protein
VEEVEVEDNLNFRTGTRAYVTGEVVDRNCNNLIGTLLRSNEDEELLVLDVFLDLQLHTSVVQGAGNDGGRID